MLCCDVALIQSGSGNILAMGRGSGASGGAAPVRGGGGGAPMGQQSQPQGGAGMGGNPLGKPKVPMSMRMA